MKRMGMEFVLNEQQEMVQSIAKEFAEKLLAKHAEQIEKNRAVPSDLYKTAGEMGLLGITFDEKYGGLGLDQKCWVVSQESLAKESPSFATCVGAGAMYTEVVNMYGTEEQKMKFLPPCLAGDVIGSFAFTEPSTGSDPKQLTTRYHKEGDFYVINGVKRFITNSGYKGPIALFANDSETGMTTAFVFDKFCEGYSLSSKWDTVSIRGSAVYDIFLDNVCVPKEAVLGGPEAIGTGFKILKGLVARSKISVTATAVGNMAKAYELAVRYAKEKMHRDKPISKFPTIQTKIAQIAGKYYSCQAYLYKMAEYADFVPDISTLAGEAATMKAHVADEGVDCCVLAMNILSAYGICDEYGVERCVRDALMAPHVEGVGDMQRIIGGSNILFK